MRIVKLCELSAMGYTYDSHRLSGNPEGFIEELIIYKDGRGVHPYLEGFYVDVREYRLVIGNYDWRKNNKEKVKFI